MTYVARVELLGNPTYTDYANLHSAMARSGFSRTIVGGDGLTYDLPHATYQSGSYSSAASARDAARKAAESVWTEVLVIVAGTDTAWYLKYNT
jgi:hypothetical protein